MLQNLTLDEAVLIGVTITGISLLGLSLVLTRDDIRNYHQIEYVPEPNKTKKAKLIIKPGIKKEESKVINKFVEMMNHENIDLSHFYENLEDYPIEYALDTVGYYDALRKKLVVNPHDIRSTLTRGLLEMNATVIHEKFVATGFERTQYKDENHTKVHYHMGYGLDEGYKDVLLNRFFGLDERFPRLAELAKMVEYLVGKERMQEQYFKGNLKGLSMRIDYHECSDPKTCIKWLIKMDDIYDAIYLDSPIKKPSLNSTYRALIIELSKYLVSKAQSIYLYTPALYKTQGRELAREMLDEVSAIITRRRALPLLAGLKEKDIKEIEEYGHKLLVNLPEQYRLHI